MPNVQPFSRWLTFEKNVEPGEIRKETSEKMLIDWQCAKRLAFEQLGFLWTGDAELLHPKLERWAFHSKFRSCSVRAGEDPIGLL
jgi:hypothetical protein